LLTLNFKKHRDYLDIWKKAMANGLMTGRPFSRHTAAQYVRYMEPFLAKHGSVSIDSLKSELSDIPTIQFAKRQALFRAVISFAKLLIQEKALSHSFLVKAKPFKPKRHLPAKRLTVKEADIQKLILATKNPLDRLLVILVASTGLRASEACQLRLQDIDFEERRLIVRCGKWGKERKVGIGDGLLQALHRYLAVRPNLKPLDLLLRNGIDHPVDRGGLYQRLQKLGRRVNVTVSPHALRRAFVTINVKNGVPLVYLQIACGHQEITTTRSYCQTSEEEVVEAMKTSFTNFS
jgi:site-specific recombinase XerD